VLAITASIFDPLGLLSPAVTAYKIFLQKLWQDNLQWDELLFPIFNKNGISYFRLFLYYQLPKSTGVICFNAINNQIIGFCDSSERAYGA
jgi:hypothetical protein